MSPPREMRQHPIGTGPFKFVEFKPNEYIKVTRNPDYWKPGRPYLDGIEYTIIRNRSTAILAFVAGKFDMTFPYSVTIPLLKDMQEPGAAGDLRDGAAAASTANLLVNRDKPPFDNPELRRAMALALDRKAFIDILSRRAGRDRRRACSRRRTGYGACRRSMLQDAAGLRPRCRRRTAPRPAQIMEKLGYGPDKRLAIKVSTRDLPPYRDPAVILIDQLKEIYIDGELEIDRHRRNWFPEDHAQGLHRRRSTCRRQRADDPDQSSREYSTAAARACNYNGYCNPEVDKLIDQQSMRGRPGKAQAAGLGDRAQAGRGRRPAGHLLSTAAGPAGSPRSRG